MSQVQNILGLLSTALFLTPVVLIIVYKLYINRSLLALAFYYLNAAIYNFMAEGIFSVPLEVKRAFGAINNYLDAPLMLIFLSLFATSRWKKQTIHITLAAFVFYNIVIAYFYHLTPVSMQLIIGPTVCIAFLYSLVLFYDHFLLATIHDKSPAKTLMTFAIVIAYGSYGILYYIYYILEVKGNPVVFSLFYIVSVFSATIMSIGIYLLSKIHRKIKEVQVVRKELAQFFGYDRNQEKTGRLNRISG